ncbi:glycosyltransferase [Psychroserpens sp. MEBiC05023]
MLIIILIISSVYLILIGSLVFGFDKITEFQLTDSAPKTHFSIIIPFRNESHNLSTLLSSIAQLHYPKSLFEIIFVNDDSTDDSVKKITSVLIDTHKLNNISITDNIRQTNSPKKDAITTAISLAKYDWIVTTDADCELPKYWLDVYDSYCLKNNCNMLVAPVTFKLANSFFQRFQLLDILSLQGATIGGFGIKKPFLCNGANLAYKKEIFQVIKGYDGNSDIASGDDIFLLEKVLIHNKDSVQYVKNNHAIVFTNPQPNFINLKEQRVRWAAKTTSYNNAFGKLVGFIVLLMNALLICLPLLYVLHIINSKTLIYTFAIKFLIDFLLLFKSSRFFNQDQYLPSFLFSSFIYPLFSVYIAFIAMFKGYKWKGRVYNK